MSYQNAFLPIQKNLFDYAAPGVDYEIIHALLSARNFNTTITERDIENGPGKVRPLKINYRPPSCSDDGDCDVDVCGTGVAVPPLQDFFNLSKCTSSRLVSIPENLMRLIDGNWTFTDEAISIIKAELPSVHKKLATQISALMVLNTGLLPDGNATRMLPWVNKNTGELNPVGLWEVERAYRDAGRPAPFIVGSTDVWYWKRAVDIGGLNNLGQDISRLGRANAYYEPLVNAAFGDNTKEHVLTFDPQMLKFMTFSENMGMFATDADRITDLNILYSRGGTDYMRGSLVDPTYGLLWDLNVKYKDCDHVFNIQWQLKWDIFFMPKNVCTIQGENGIYHWTTCAQTIETCPDGSPIEPASTDTFDLQTSGFTFPMFIHKLQVAGQTTEPNVTVANVTELTALLNAEIQGYTFSVVSSTKIRYTGYSAIAGAINDTLTLTWVA